jgi:hypothetical protein
LNPPSGWRGRTYRGWSFLSLLCFLLFGYAVGGKAFAYLGYSQIYAGEIVLLVGTFGFLLSVRRWMALRDWAVTPLLLFMLLGAVRTVPGVMEHGVSALRDAVIWGYGWFAVLVFTLLATQPRAFPWLLDRYARFVRVVILLVPLIWLASTGLGLIDFEIGGRSVLILKGGEIMVHGCGILAFLYVYQRKLPAFWLLPLPLFFAIGMTTRAGLLSLLATVVTLQILRPAKRRWFITVGIVAVGLVVMAVADVRVPVSANTREISFDTLTWGVASIFGDTGNMNYDGSRRWRLQWWGKIADYTWRGDYFWTGKGFGVNLADEDGFTGDFARSLRSPHSGHLTVLARMGVPGLALWALAQFTWAGGMLVGYIRSRRTGAEPQARLYLFLLAYWVSFMVNASFDVFLEGPMAGIWFWTLYGVGLAAMRIPGRARGRVARGAPVGTARCWPTPGLAGCPAQL